MKKQILAIKINTIKASKKSSRLNTLIIIKKITIKITVSNFQKLILVLTISMLITNSGEKTILNKIPYIYYPIQIYQDKISALHKSKSKINAINSHYN